MAVIENDIQYNWVRKRVSKLKEKVDENTPTNNPCRIELELLSKLEKEYCEEHASALKAIKIIENIERTQVNVYEGMAMVAEMVKMKAFSEATGKTQALWSAKMNHNIKNGKELCFVEADLSFLNDALLKLSKKLAKTQIVYCKNRETVVEQIREVDKIVSMPYIYDNVLGKGRVWYKDRMRMTLANGRPYYFHEDDIQKMNNAIITISNRLKSIELVL